jgi:hypothetical protein
MRRPIFTILIPTATLAAALALPGALAAQLAPIAFGPFTCSVARPDETGREDIFDGEAKKDQCFLVSVDPPGEDEHPCPAVVEGTVGGATFIFGTIEPGKTKKVCVPGDKKDKVKDVLIWCKGDSRLEQCSGTWLPL